MQNFFAMKVVKPSSKAAVVVFDEKSYGIKKMKSLDGKKFVKRKQPSEEEDGQDEEMTSLPGFKHGSTDPDDIADMEVSQLWERLQSSVEDIAASDLKGKAKRDHLVNKAARLAGTSVPKPKAPFKIRMGMKDAQKKREKKAKDLAREMDGVVLARPYAASTSKKQRGSRPRR